MSVLGHVGNVVQVIDYLSYSYYYSYENYSLVIVIVTVTNIFQLHLQLQLILFFSFFMRLLSYGQIYRSPNIIHTGIRNKV
jgi:hypothetical protein